MIKIKIAETAQRNGLKSAYALQKALNISPTIAARLWKGNFDKIGINTLERLCEYLQCQTNDLLEYPITQTSKALDSSGIKELPVLDAKTDYWMATQHIAEVVGLDARTVRDFYKQGLPFTKTSKGNFVKFSDYSIFIKNRKQNQK